MFVFQLAIDDLMLLGQLHASNSIAYLTPNREGIRSGHQHVALPIVIFLDKELLFIFIRFLFEFMLVCLCLHNRDKDMDGWIIFQDIDT